MSFYWFKREHKFELYNHTRHESVRVMLVQYPANPLVIVQSEIYVSGQQLHSYTVEDDFGNVDVIYYWTDMYSRQVWLNDGSVWIVGNYDDFRAGRKAYIGVSKDGKEVVHSLIVGSEREGTFARATCIRLGRG